MSLLRGKLSRRLLWLVLGVALFSVMLVLAIPAKLVFQKNWIGLPPALQVDGVSGQWWSGKAAAVTWYGKPRGQLSWRYHFPDKIKVNLQNSQQEINSTIQLKPLLADSQHAVIDDIVGHIQASELPTLHSGVVLQGELVFNLVRLQALRNQLLNIDGQVSWHQARLTGSVALDLGQVDIQVMPQGAVTKLDLGNNNSGDVLIFGSGTLAVDHYNLELHIRAGFGKDQLRAQLAQLGELNPDGSTTLYFQGQF